MPKLAHWTFVRRAFFLGEEEELTFCVLFGRPSLGRPTWSSPYKALKAMALRNLAA
jgi:hypothetical protein